MRGNSARRLVSLAQSLARGSGRAGSAGTAALPKVSEAARPSLANPAQLWPVCESRGFAKQPPPDQVPIDHEHSNVSNEIEKELLRASGTTGVSGLLQVIEQHGEDFDEQNVATAFHELAKATEDKDLKDVHVHDTFQALVDMAIMGRRRFNARLLTSIVKSAAELKFSDEALLDKLSQNLLSRIDKLDAIEVTDLATGLAAMDHSPSVVLFEALQKQANAIEKDFSSEQRKALKAAYEKLGYAEYAEKL